MGVGRAASGGHSASRALPTWLVVGGVVALSVFYLVTGAENHAEADDAFWYAEDVEAAPWPDLLDPFHFLYLPMMRMAWLGARGVGLAERAFPVMVFLGAVFAAVAVVGFGVLLRRRLSLSPAASFAGTATLAVAYGFWRYAAEAEVYAFAIMNIVLFFVVVLRDPGTRPGRWLVASVLLGAAAVGSHILAVIPVLLAAPAQLVLEGRARRAAAVTATVVAVLLAGSALVYPIAARPGQSYVDYVTRDIGDEPGRSFGGQSDIVGMPVGLGQALLASNLVVTSDRLYETVSARFPGKMLEDERFTAVRTPRIVRQVATSTFLLGVGLLAVLAVASSVRLIPRVLEPGVGPYALWTAGHAAALLSVGNVIQLEAWPLALPSIVVLLAAAADGSARQPPRREWIYLLALLMAVHNGVAGMLPLADASRDRNAVRAAWIIDNTASHDVVFVADSPGFARYLEYWSFARIVDLQLVDAGAVDSVFSATARSAAGRVYATRDLFDPPGYFRHVHPDRAAAIADLAARIEPSAVPVAADRTGTTYTIATARTDEQR